jgi:hypothetical protein
MNSPPKKRSSPNITQGGGISSSVNSPINTPQPSAFPKNRENPRPITPAFSPIDRKFDLIYNEIENQCKYNANFDTRICSLETTKRNIDSKIIILLDRMAPSSPLTHKLINSNGHLVTP